MPDAGHAQLIEAAHADPAMRAVVLTTEEEGIALAAGAWLGGQRAALLMQSSGVGNCINMLSLPVTCRMPFLTLITMRGEWARVQPVAGADGHRHAHGSHRRPGCTSGAPTTPAMPPRSSPPRRRWHSTARCPSPCCSRSGWSAPRCSRNERRPNDGTLDRRAVAAALLRDPGDLLVVTGLGAPTYDAAAAGERPLNFYLWGAMGGAAMVGLGLALAQPRRRVLVLTGDGEMLMGMGALATIAAAGAPNLAIAVLDNARYGETGGSRAIPG